MRVFSETDLVFRDVPAGRFRCTISDHEPVLLVQKLTRNVILCGGPTEHFSEVVRQGIF